MIVAPVTGATGDHIQAWRQKFDPQQALRLPPHATVLYWANLESDQDAALTAQIHHAFPGPISVQLGEVKQFPNADQTRYIEIKDTAELDAARSRLFDGTHLMLPGQRQTWDWHVTVVRYAVEADMSVIEPAIAELVLDEPWLVDTLLLLELRNGLYHQVTRWDLRQRELAPGS